MIRNDTQSCLILVNLHEIERVGLAKILCLLYTLSAQNFVFDY
jgi:hypothetical protein